MMKQAVTAAVLAGGLASTSAMAFVNGELLVGKRWMSVKYEGKDSGISSFDKTLGLMLDPIPLVPVAFGAYYTIPDWKKSDLNAKSVDATEYGLSVKAWLPIPGIDWIPYLRLNYPLKSSFTVTREDSPKAKYKVDGALFRAGVEYDLTGPVNLLFETGYATQNLKVESAGQSVKKNAKVQDVLVGIEAGI